MAPRPSPTNVLELTVEVVPDDVDYVVPQPTRYAVAIRVDGANPFATTHTHWRGFDPDDILGSDAPLIPAQPPRRVAVQVCACGFGGCGALAPVISCADGVISWTDFRDYTGVFESGPLTNEPLRHRGRPAGIPDLHFDAAHYRAEVSRATNYRS